jgi:segregation and condensation protein A
MQDKIWDVLLEEEEIGWRSILYDLVKSEKMDPWDINITLLTQKYIQVVKELPEHDLKVSGKIILAAALLLKMKCSHLIDNDISKFDDLMNPHDELDDIDEELYDAIEGHPRDREKQMYKLIPRNPQPRNRKVSIHDLVEALQRALVTKKRVLDKIRPENFSFFTKKKYEIMEVIKDVQHKIEFYSRKEDNITFQRLLPPNPSREDKVYTFLPLLHLENHEKIEMEQEKAFEEIHIKMLKGKKVKNKVS